jgi:RNA polymerase sigma-B factor
MGLKNMTRVLSPKDLKLDTLDLFQQYQHSGSRILRNQIMELNLGLVKKEAHRWSTKCSETYEDLMQVGCLGLLRAIERFNPEKGYAFSSFALPYIRGEIQHYLRDRGCSVKMPRRWLELWQQAKNVKQDFRKQFNRQPTDGEIAHVLEIPLEEWQEITLASQNREPLSLDLPLGDGQEGNNSLGDSVPDNRYRSFQLAEEDRIRLQQALSKLEEKTRDVLEFVFLKDLTQKETAEQLGISIVTVSRRVKKGLESLKGFMSQEIF